jgi:ATP-binding cassette subfamily B protein
VSWDFGGFGGGHGRPGAPQSGLPFGGVPEEMQEGIRRIIADEPEHDVAPIPFRYRANEQDEARVTLRSLLLAHWRLGIAAILLVAAVAVLSQAGPKLINVAIDRGMVDHQRMSVITVAALLFLGSVGLASLAQMGQTRVTGRLAASVMHDLRVRVFAHLQRLGLDFYTEEKAGVVMTRMTSDIENLQQLLQDGLAQIAVQALTMIVISAVLLSMNVELALLSIVIAVVPLALLSVWFRRRSERGYDRVRDGIAEVMADLSENLHGIRVVTMHNRQRHNIVHHRNLVGTYREANDYTARVASLYGSGTQLLGWLSQAVLLGVGGHMVQHGSLSVGELVAFCLYLNRFFSPIQLLVQQYNVYQQSQASMTKLRTLLAIRPNVAERADAVDLPTIDGTVALEHVRFGYDVAEPVIEDVSLRISPGETVAFVGPTGAGKSTIAKIVSRFYDPDEGRVTIDGHDLRGVTLRSLRSQLGVVSQEPFLFAGTVRDNIAFAHPEATDAEVTAAVNAVGLDDLVSRLPDGIDSLVHERGNSLSAGERQLIALARTLLAQPRLLILDEATSNLDLQSEAQIEAALDRLLEGRTAILIAHRLTTAMKADRVVVIDDGRIVEIGSHVDLVADGGRYAAMFEHWQSHTISEGASATT